MKIYTKTGDGGETGLFGGGRTPKDSPRVAAYGEVDELNAALGLAHALAPEQFADALLQSIQRDLFTIGAELATPDPDKLHKALSRSGAAIGQSDKEDEELRKAAWRGLRRSKRVRQRAKAAGEGVAS